MEGEREALLTFAPFQRSSSMLLPGSPLVVVAGGDIELIFANCTQFNNGSVSASGNGARQGQHQPEARRLSCKCQLWSNQWEESKSVEVLHLTIITLLTTKTVSQHTGHSQT